MIDKLKIYISDNFNPYENLASEKILFDNVFENECILYLWQNKNTVVIGRNQNPWAECNLEEMKKDDVLLAKRLSGGGAVYHDLGNLNFTFIMKEDNHNLLKQLSVIQNACLLAGINAEISGRNDILSDGKKFSGNAFYNSKGTSYHHGTILINSNKEKIQKYLTPNELKLKTKGVNSVKSRVMNLCELNKDLTIKQMKDYMIKSFEEVYGLAITKIDNLPTKEVLKISKKFNSWNYLYANTAPFTFSCDGYFEWGTIELKLNVKNGTIIFCDVFTDSMDWTLSEKIKKILTNCKFEKESIKNALICSGSEIADDLVSLIEKQKI